MKFPLLACILIGFVILTVISTPAEASRVRKLRIAKKLGALLLLHRKKYLFAVPFPLPVPVPVLKKTQPIIYKEKVAVPVPVPEAVPVPEPYPQPVPYEAPPKNDYPSDNSYPDESVRYDRYENNRYENEQPYNVPY